MRVKKQQQQKRRAMRLFFRCGASAKAGFVENRLGKTAQEVCYLQLYTVHTYITAVPGTRFR